MGGMHKTKVLPFSLDLEEQILSLKKHKNLTLVNVGNITAKSFLISRLAQQTNFKNIFWASTDEQADAIFSTAEIFFGQKLFQIPAEVSVEKFYELREALQSDEENLFLFDNLESILKQDFPSEADIEREKVVLEKGDKVQIFELFSDLEKIGLKASNDPILLAGEFVRKGDNFFVCPPNKSICYRVELFGDEIEKIVEYNQESKKAGKVVKALEIFPKEFSHMGGKFLDLISDCERSCVISDDLDEEVLGYFNGEASRFYKIKFTTFPDNAEIFFHLNFFSVLPFYTIPDFVVDMKERLRRGFRIVVGTKKFAEVERIFRDNEVMFQVQKGDEELTSLPSTVEITEFANDEFLPHSFQNNDRQILFLTDREIFQFHRSSRQKKAIAGVNFDLMTSLKPGNFVIHLEHGVAQFDGIVRRKLSGEAEREYLKLNYAANDKLFVPVESAEKITKFIGDDEPRLHRLGSADWQKSQKKLKVDTEKIAKELLKIYAKRELAKSEKFPEDDAMMQEFYDSFPYEPTPGQASAWYAVSKDLESN